MNFKNLCNLLMTTILFSTTVGTAAVRPAADVNIIGKTRDGEACLLVIENSEATLSFEASGESRTIDVNAGVYTGVSIDNSPENDVHSIGLNMGVKEWISGFEGLHPIGPWNRGITIGTNAQGAILLAQLAYKGPRKSFANICYFQ